MCQLQLTTKKKVTIMIMTCKTKGVLIYKELWRWLMVPVGAKWVVPNFYNQDKSCTPLLSFRIQNPLTWKGPSEEEHCNTVKRTYCNDFLQLFPNEIYGHILLWLSTLARNTNSSRLLDSESQVTLNPWDPSIIMAHLLEWGLTEAR